MLQPGMTSAYHVAATTTNGPPFERVTQDRDDEDHVRQLNLLTLGKMLLRRKLPIVHIHLQPSSRSAVRLPVNIIERSMQKPDAVHSEIQVHRFALETINLRSRYPSGGAHPSLYRFGYKQHFHRPSILSSDHYSSTLMDVQRCSSLSSRSKILSCARKSAGALTRL